MVQTMKAMSYKQIKWLILLIPTITVGLWEYVRHTPFMLGHLSMETGNWLTPVIVFAVTMILVRKLFEWMEDMHKTLEEERAIKVMLEEREHMARQLHDGIAQSLFLLSVKMNRWEAQEPHLPTHEQYQQMRKTIQHIHDDVRQSIFNLRHPTDIDQFPWTKSLQQLVDDFRKDSGLHVQFQWALPEEQLSTKEKVELYACIKEALMNVHKHAQASSVIISAQTTKEGWRCTVEDDGRGFAGVRMDDHNARQTGYGMEIMRDRAREMGWKIDWIHREEGTCVKIRKGVKD